VVFVVDDLAAWLAGLLADAGRKKLTTLVLGVLGLTAVVGGSIAGGGWPSTPRADTTVTRRPR
jgi:hypothetical protein